MAPPLLTPDFLMSRAKTRSLSAIKTLDLSGLDLDKLDGQLLNELTDLEVLDVSKNCLSSFPADVSLPMLRKLDCRENRLNCVTFVKIFPRLEEFYVMGNGLKPADRYIVAAVCQSLKKFDTNNLVSLNTIVSSVQDVIEPELHDEWEKNYASKLKAGEVSSDDEDSITQSISQTLHQKYSSWSSKMKELLGEFMIDYLTEKLVHTELSKVTSPRRKKVAVSKLSVISVSSRKLNKSRKIPHKRKSVVNQSLPSKHPLKKLDASPAENEMMDVSPARENTPKRGVKRKYTEIKSRRSSGCDIPEIGSQCPAVDDYDPVHFIRCHFGDAQAKKKGHTLNDPTDGTTGVWACRFEPDSNTPGGTTNVIATCGGENVCLIDCSSGHVLLKYHQPNMHYSCLAWTSLLAEHEARERSQNILAVAGKGGRIELIDVTRHECYAMFGTDRPNKMMGSQDYCINWLLFHRSQPHILFAGASDAVIEVWSVSLDAANNMLIGKLSAPGIQIMDMLWYDQTEHLLAACEGGLFAWKITSASLNNPNTKLREPNVTLDLPSKGNDEPYVDAITLLTDDVAACKIVGTGRLLIFSLKSTLSKSAKSKRLKVEALFYLNWKETSADFLHMQAQNGLLACGDDSGHIWIYNLQSWLSHPRLSKSEHLIEPSRMLMWPECDTTSHRQQEQMMTDLTNMSQDPGVVINCCAVSGDRTWLASVTSNNLVCLWKAAS